MKLDEVPWIEYYAQGITKLKLFDFRNVHTQFGHWICLLFPLICFWKNAKHEIHEPWNFQRSVLFKKCLTFLPWNGQTFVRTFKNYILYYSILNSIHCDQINTAWITIATKIKLTYRYRFGHSENFKIELKWHFLTW